MSQPAQDELTPALARFMRAFETLCAAPPFAKGRHRGRVLDTAERVLGTPGGPAAMYPAASRFAASGLFDDTDWARPDRLQANLAPTTLRQADRWTSTLECLSLLRLLAIAEGRTVQVGMSGEQAGHHLRDVLALSLGLLFERKTEAERAARGRLAAPRNLLRFLAETVGYDGLLQQLVEEVWRLLRQRPIEVKGIRAMITELAAYCFDPERSGAGVVPRGAERLISALYGPSPASREDPGLEVYAARLAAMDASRRLEEASACARAMHDTGLVSPYHAVLLRHLLEEAPDTLGVALGLSATGLDGLLTYRELVHALVREAVFPETCQCAYGLAALLERAVLHNPGVAPSLWRQIKLPLCEAARARLVTAYGPVRSPEVHLLAGTISILGLPLGVGQGDNPTCQAARALSLWSYTDPDYLLQLLTWAARDNEIRMTFHDRTLSSAALPEGGAGAIGIDLDPVSLVLVPHLDRVYAEMSRLTASLDRQDPHIHVNPEFHGWRVGRGFAIAVDVETGKLRDYEGFVRLFYACYHPAYNGGQPVIHPQPVGLAVTDAHARFVGWHAITLLRVTLDAQGETRVYFFNPNNDKGQDWGHGVVVSTAGNGEVAGESSLPVTQFASRLYLFHYDALEVGDVSRPPQEEMDVIRQAGRASWAAERLPLGGDLGS